MDLIFKEYKRKGNATVVPFLEYMAFAGNLDGVSVSAPDNELAIKNATEFEKGYIARNPENHEDKWYISKEYFDKNFEEPLKAGLVEKTLNNVDIEDVKKKVSDVEVFGDGNLFELISKASSKDQGWMKSTKAMQVRGHANNGVVIQVTTQQINPDRSYSIAEALTYVPGGKIEKSNNGNKYISI